MVGGGGIIQKKGWGGLRSQFFSLFHEFLKNLYFFIKINPEEYEILEIEDRNDMDEIQVIIYNTLKLKILLIYFNCKNIFFIIYYY